MPSLNEKSTLCSRAHGIYAWCARYLPTFAKSPKRRASSRRPEVSNADAILGILYSGPSPPKAGC